MPVALLVSIIVATIILLRWLHDVKAEVKKSARENGDSHHER